MNFDANVLQVAIEDIIPNRFQPRLNFEEKSLLELSESIKQHGIIQPLVLRKVGDKYEIIAGERRYKAATMAGLASVPAVISQVDDKTSAEVAVVENIQRKDLSAIEEAKSYKALLDQGYMSQDQLAKKMGLSQSAISNKLRLLSLPEEIQNAVMANQISERHARSLLSIKKKEKQLEAMERVINERLTVRKLDELIKSEYSDFNESPVNIAEIKETAIDIKPPVEAAPVIEKKEDPFAMGAINLGQRTQNKFFNTLEDEAANMQMTEAINPFSNFNDKSALSSTSTVDTFVNKAEKIEENPKIEFATANDTILGGINDIELPKLNDAPKTENIFAEPSAKEPLLNPSSSTTNPKYPSIFDFMNLNSQTSGAPNTPLENKSSIIDTPKLDEPDSLVKAESPVIPSLTPANEIDSLDSLDFEPPKEEKQVKDVNLAVDKINNVVNELRLNNYPINSVKSDLADQVTITITITKKEE